MLRILMELQAGLPALFFDKLPPSGLLPHAHFRTRLVQRNMCQGAFKADCRADLVLCICLFQKQIAHTSSQKVGCDWPGELLFAN